MWNSLMSYHPLVGYTYTPSLKSRVPWETGGYLVRTNSAGFRAEREYIHDRTPGKFRALQFGDSMTAGDGVSNTQRYSDLLEKTVPNLEVYNYGLPGCGTDQHYLAYRECADVEHDLLIIAVNVENITRVNAQILIFHDENGNEVFYGKPYYEIEKGQLVLRNVPAPKRPWTKETLPPEHAKHVDWGGRVFPGAQAVLRRIVPIERVHRFVAKVGLRDLIQKVIKPKRLPAYESPDNPGWLLLRKVIESWIRESETPVLLVPMPMWAHCEETSDPSDYQARFRELAADTGCHFHDPLSDLLAYSPEDRRAFRFQEDVHFTREGHKALARSIAPAVEKIARESQV